MLQMRYGTVRMDDEQAHGRSGVARLLRFCRSPLGVKLFRYVMGSVITTVVSFFVLTLVYGVLRWWSAVPSTVVANVVATVPAYWLNRTWTWGKVGRSDPWREVAPFWVLSVLGIAISMGTAALAADVARSHHFGHLTSIVVVDGANLLAYGVLFVGKYLVFERLFRVAEAVRAARAAAGPAAGMPSGAAGRLAASEPVPLCPVPSLDVAGEGEPSLVAASGGAG